MANERILAIGTIVAGGEVDWHIAPLPVLDGELQATIDEAAELAEYQEDMLDREFWSQGGW